MSKTPDIREDVEFLDQESSHLVSSEDEGEANGVTARLRGRADYPESPRDFRGSERLKTMDRGTTSSAMFRTTSVQVEPDVDVAAPYSRFGSTEKWFLVVQCAFTGFFSTIAGSIYYPVLTVIERKFHITEEQVNLTVVVYFIFQGLSPSIMGGFADSLGRRPVVLSSVLTYCAACIGLARAQTYAQIVVLRCLQAAGISPVIAINSGIMGDVTTKAERGGYVGYVSGFQVIGGSTGALIGALLAARWDWRAIFWFLAIGSGICAFFGILLLPETKRTIVGNGSIRPKSIPNIAPVLGLPVIQKKLHLNDPDLETLEPRNKVNFFAIFSVLKVFEMDLVLVSAGLQYALWTAQQTSLSLALSKRYHLDVTKIGLCYLPGGLCTLISVITTGRYLNFSYRRMFKKHKKWLKDQESKLLTTHNGNREEVEKLIEEDPYYTFNLCRARMHPALVTLFLSSSFFCAFGWCIERHAPLAAVLVFSGLGCLFSNCILTMSTTLMVDLFPSKASTATGCLNLFRCSLAAIYVSCLSKMVESINFGGVFTLLGAISFSSSLSLLWVIRNGKAFCHKRKRIERELSKAAEEEQQRADSPDNKSTESEV